MLVLSRKKDEVVVIGEGASQVRVMVLELRGATVRLGFEADVSVKIHRQEVYDSIQKAKEEVRESDDEMSGGLYAEEVR